MKRALDVVFAAMGLVLLSPLLAVVACLVKLTSPGPVLFRQQRAGRGLLLFEILKFRTMVQDAPLRGAAITVGGDPRITWVGQILRRTKIDELPQLINVLRGEMSLVGPRPEVPRYVAMFPAEFAEILRARPGITDLASLRYRNEADLLASAEDPERLYVREVLPRKLQLAQEYVRTRSLLGDLRILARTLLVPLSSGLQAAAGGQKTSGECVSGMALATGSRIALATGSGMAESTGNPAAGAAPLTCHLTDSLERCKQSKNGRAERGIGPGWIGSQASRKGSIDAV